MIAALRQTVSIGPLSIPWAFIALILAWIIYQLLIKRFYREQNERLQKVDRILFNSLFIILLVWKLSPLLFQFSTVIKNPVAVLYLPGGTAGIVLGITVAAVFASVSILRQKERRRVLLKSLGFNAGVLLVLVVVLSSGTALLVKGLSVQSSDAVFGTGTAAPGFELKAADGKLYRLSDYAGQTVVLNFWASWCPPCRAELPELKSFYEELNPAEAAFLSINLYTSEKKPAELPAFIEAEGLSFPVLYDLSGEVAESYAVQSIPTTVVIKPDGTILKVKNGAVTGAWLNRMVKETLRK
ncbi:MAG TPA: hypothetical protein DCO79_09375 [Spirochaeta sp.]|nr:hypothetical protein [Spirochaeta sp.]